MAGPGCWPFFEAWSLIQEAAEVELSAKSATDLSRTEIHVREH
jgi:hypothetical protein